jgi:hypothetical protein
MPFAGFKDFDACVISMKEKQGYSEEVAKKVCGKLKSDHEKDHPIKSVSNSQLSAFLAFPANMVNFTDCPISGDTIFHDVVIIGEGSWTDSMNKRPLHYTASELSNMQFKKMSFKAEHDIYNELPITNEIGVIENTRLSLNPAQWKADIRVFPTALGKDIATLIKRKQITDISPEFYFDEYKNNDTPIGIKFMGAATVRKGACRVCTFNEGISDDTTTGHNMPETTSNPAGSSGGAAAVLDSGSKDIRDLELKLADAQKNKSADVDILNAQLEEVRKVKWNKLTAELDSSNQKIIELERSNKELIAALAKIDHDGKIRDLETRIKELVATPLYQTNVSATLSQYNKTAQLDTDPEFAPVSIQDFGE